MFLKKEKTADLVLRATGNLQPDQATGPWDVITPWFQSGFRGECGSLTSWKTVQVLVASTEKGLRGHGAMEVMWVMAKRYSSSGRADAEQHKRTEGLEKAARGTV